MSAAIITPLILTYNEDANIDRALRQLTWADEVLVVDSFSTDRTLEIVSRYPNVRITQRRFDHFAEQLNFGLTHVTTPWVLTMDADYVLSDALVAELREGRLQGDYAGYRIAFRYCVAGKPLRGSIYPPRIALFQKARGGFKQDGHAQELVLDGKVGMLQNVIYHDDRKPLSVFLRNQEWYETLEAQKLSAPGLTTLSILDRARRTRWLAPILVLVYCLFWKGLILEGKRGLYYSLQRAYVELLLSIKLLDLDLSKDLEQREAQKGSQIDQSTEGALTSQARATTRAT